jgi:hypothetical protein
VASDPLTPDEQRSIFRHLGTHPDTASVACTGLLLARVVATVDAERDRADQAETRLAAAHNAMRQALDPTTTVNDAWRLLAEHVGWQDGRAATGEGTDA